MTRRVVGIGTSTIVSIVWCKEDFVLETDASA